MLRGGGCCGEVCQSTATAQQTTTKRLYFSSDIELYQLDLK